MNRDTNTDYWKSRDNTSGGNSPKFYATRTDRTGDILKFIDDLDEISLDEKTKILDIGCNAGGLLNQFHLAGCNPKNLFGIEPNPNAHKERKQHFPDLLDKNIKKGTFAEAKPRRKVDLACASAVLVHLTDEDRQEVIDWMASNAKYFLLVINPGGKKRQDPDGRIWNPDSKKQVQATGAKLIGSRPWKPYPTWTLQLWKSPE